MSASIARARPRSAPVPVPGPSPADPPDSPQNDAPDPHEVAAATAEPWRCTVSSCGARMRRWQLVCPACGTTGRVLHRPPNYVATEPAATTPRGHRLDALAVSPGSVARRTYARIGSGFAGLDRLLNGGWAIGTLALLGGKAGVGKSRLALQSLQALATAGHAVAFVSGEMGDEAIGLAQDVGATHPRLHVVPEARLETALAACARLGARLVVVDSANRVVADGSSSPPGSGHQVAAVMRECKAWAREHEACVALLAHATKLGGIKGSTDLEHDPDIVMRLRFQEEPHRCLVTDKTRLGGPRRQRAWLRFTTDGRLEDCDPLVRAPAPVHDAGHGGTERARPVDPAERRPRGRPARARR